MSRPVSSQVVERLRSILESRSSDSTLSSMIGAQKEVLGRFQPIFTTAGLKKLDAATFREFLLYRNNKHWTGLHRMGPATTRDIRALRGALAEVLDDSVPVGRRLDALLPRGRARVTGLGKAILTPVLLIAYPHKYGVWNGTSERAMRDLHIFPEFDRGTSIGDQYEQLNDLLLDIAAKVEVDLWTLDGLWWRVLNVDPPTDTDGDEALTDGTSRSDAAQFGLERHLHEFLIDNWDRTSLSKEWELCEEGGDIEGYGSERPTPIGRIDLLARSRKGKEWLVIELKRDQTSDTTVGQVMRYMGWVRKELAGKGEKVNGLIVGLHEDERLRYALMVSEDIRFMRYEVDFRLVDGRS